MTRSPLAYPLNRSADSDGGGAADLQTDIMRFMAILSLCLVAIFALVQSIPLTPVEMPEPPSPAAEVVERPTQATPPQPVATPAEPPPAKPTPAVEEIVEETLTLTRPKWVPKFTPESIAAAPAVDPAPPSDQVEAPAVVEQELAVPDKEGFTLRFESDAALTRAVAATHVGVYAIEAQRAQRMTVSNSRISFWDASIPNTFHEMEAATVPTAVIDALGRTGTNTNSVEWGVTLPGKLKTQLDSLMREHTGGSLIIEAGGSIRWEAS